MVQRASKRAKISTVAVEVRVSNPNPNPKTCSYCRCSPLNADYFDLAQLWVDKFHRFLEEEAELDKDVKDLDDGPV